MFVHETLKIVTHTFTRIAGANCAAGARAGRNGACSETMSSSSSPEGAALQATATHIKRTQLNLRLICKCTLHGVICALWHVRSGA